MESTATRFSRSLFMGLACWASVAHAAGSGPMLERPGEREFVRDLADLLDPATENKIRRQCDQLLTETATPVIVVTVDSLASHGGQGETIESFATQLFNQWQIGHVQVEGAYWNTGILLLVAREDRRSRIELGNGWEESAEETCQQIMNTMIIPRFKQGEFSSGIAAGVDGLERMVHGRPLPTAEIPAWKYAIGFAGLGLGVFTIISLSRRGTNGQAWAFWGLVFTVLAFTLRHLATGRRRERLAGRFGGRGSGGGSFGGGFSSGRGASGSW